MIRFEDVTLTYPGADVPALRGVEAVVAEGELCLVIGPTGSGKSSLLGAASARVPHATGGLLQGRVLVAGVDTRRRHDLADVVGVVGQDPLAGFVTDTVEEELAFGMEQLGLPGPVMRRRVEEVLDLLALAPLRDRPLLDLSGGEQQRVALGAVLTAQPRVLILDEPTSALDPTAAEEVLAALTRLVHDLGITVLLAEHRLERVVQFADSVLALDGAGRAVHGSPAEVLAGSPLAPPVVALGRLAGWDPVPLSVRDARRRAAPLRDRLRDPLGHHALTAPGPPALTARGLHVRYGPVHALRGVDLDLRAGEVTAVMGRNGSGKSSLLWALQGRGPRSAGTVRLSEAVGAPAESATRGGSGGALEDPAGGGSGGTGPDPAHLDATTARRLVALVPQTPADLLYLDTVRAECDLADAQAGSAPGEAAATLAALAPGVLLDAHPRDISEGERLALALAVQLAGEPGVLLLDEPTRGLDAPAKARLAGLLGDLARRDRCVVLSSHDVEFVAECADRVVVLGEGEAIADGPAAEILLASPTLAPQVARILHPVPALTIADVAGALAVAP